MNYDQFKKNFQNHLLQYFIELSIEDKRDFIEILEWNTKWEPFFHQKPNREGNYQVRRTNTLDVAFWDGTKWIENPNSTIKEYKDITHWMPLPED